MPEALTEADRGALCEECEQWEYNEDGSCRTFMVCGACWNKQVERTRLERAVIEATKAERKAALDYDKRMVLENWKRTVDTRQQRESTVEALIEFESRQIKK